MHPLGHARRLRAALGDFGAENPLTTGAAGLRWATGRPLALGPIFSVDLLARGTILPVGRRSQRSRMVRECDCGAPDG